MSTVGFRGGENCVDVNTIQSRKKYEENGKQQSLLYWVGNFHLRANFHTASAKACI